MDNTTAVSSPAPISIPAPKHWNGTGLISGRHFVRPTNSCAVDPVREMEVIRELRAIRARSNDPAPITSRTLSNLNFLLKRHKLTGFDCDYVRGLTEEQGQFMEHFARTFYDGKRQVTAGLSEAEINANEVVRKEANQRRYNLKTADAMARLDSFFDYKAFPLENLQADDLDPETLLILRESAAEMEALKALPRRKKRRKKSSETTPSPA